VGSNPTRPTKPGLGLRVFVVVVVAGLFAEKPWFLRNQFHDRRPSQPCPTCVCREVGGGLHFSPLMISRLQNWRFNQTYVAPWGGSSRSVFEDARLKMCAGALGSPWIAERNRCDSGTISLADRTDFPSEFSEEADARRQRCPDHGPWAGTT